MNNAAILILCLLVTLVAIFAFWRPGSSRSEKRFRLSFPVPVSAPKDTHSPELEPKPVLADAEVDEGRNTAATAAMDVPAPPVPARKPFPKPRPAKSAAPVPESEPKPAQPEPVRGDKTAAVLESLGFFPLEESVTRQDLTFRLEGVRITSGTVILFFVLENQGTTDILLGAVRVESGGVALNAELRGPIVCGAETMGFGSVRFPAADVVRGTVDVTLSVSGGKRRLTIRDVEIPL